MGDLEVLTPRVLAKWDDFRLQTLSTFNIAITTYSVVQFEECCVENSVHENISSADEYNKGEFRPLSVVINSQWPSSDSSFTSDVTLLILDP